MRPYIAVEIDGVLSPYAGPVPAGYTVHSVESAAWRDWAVWVYPRPAGLRLALNPAIGRALAELPADLVLVSTYSPAEVEPLLPALGWETVPPMIPLPSTGSLHYMRVDDSGRSPDAEDGLPWRAEEIASWARTHDRPVAWVRAGDEHREAVRRTASYLSTVGPVLAYGVDPTAGITPADLAALRESAAALVFTGVVRARTTRAGVKTRLPTRACCSVFSRPQSRRWVASHRPMSSPCRVIPGFMAVRRTP